MCVRNPVDISKLGGCYCSQYNISAGRTVYKETIDLRYYPTYEDTAFPASIVRGCKSIGGHRTTKIPNQLLCNNGVP